MWWWLVVSFFGGALALWLLLWGLAVLDQWDDQAWIEEERKRRE